MFGAISGMFQLDSDFWRYRVSGWTTDDDVDLSADEIVSQFGYFHWKINRQVSLYGPPVSDVQMAMWATENRYKLIGTGNTWTCWMHYQERYHESRH